MSPATFSSIIKGMFLFAYAAFLAASISHVAYFFHSFEPVTVGENWWQEWSGPYALAGSIDVTGLVLTVGVTYMRNGVNGFALTVIWCFIFLLTGFSWTANWEYAQQFQSLGLSKAANQQVFFFPFTFGQLNPVLASSFAFLNLAYSIVADFFNAKSKTPEEIRTEAEQLQAIAAATKGKKAAQAELRAVNDEGTKRWIKGKLEMIQDVFPGKKPTENKSPSQVSANPKEQEAPLQSGTQKGRDTGPLLPVSPTERGRQNDGKALATHNVKPIEQSEQNMMGDDGKTGAKTEERQEQNNNIAVSDPAVISVLNRYPKINAWLSAGQRTATIEEIVDATQLSKRRVANRVHDGTLKRAPRNAQFILISSVIAWLKTAPPPQQNDAMLREQPAIQLVEKVG